MGYYQAPFNLIYLCEVLFLAIAKDSDCEHLLLLILYFFYLPTLSISKSKSMTIE